VEALSRGGEAVSWEPPMQLGAVNHFMPKSVEQARLQGSRKDLPFRRTRIDAPGDEQQLLVGLSLQLPPELVRSLEQRDVARVLGIGQPDDSGESVGGAMRVDQIKSFQP